MNIAPHPTPFEFDLALLDQLSAQARQSPRLRSHLSLHESPHAACQRLLIAIEPGSYVTPHRHIEPDKAETFVVIRGSLGFLTFDETGKIMHQQRLSTANTLTAPSLCFGMHLPANTFHTTFALEPGTVFFESKAGPYVPFTDKDFPSWAPKEGDAQCKQQLRQWQAIFE